MFNKFNEAATPVAHEGREAAIEALKKGVQNEKLPTDIRKVRAEALINLLKEELAKQPDSVEHKINLAEAETYRDQLVKDKDIANGDE